MSNETSKTCWQPVSPQEAEALWTTAQQSAYADIRDSLGGTTDSFWVVGEHGGQPFGVSVRKDRRISVFTLNTDRLVLPKLPKIRHASGSYSLLHFISDCVVNPETPNVCSEEGSSGYLSVCEACLSITQRSHIRCAMRWHRTIMKDRN